MISTCRLLRKLAIAKRSSLPGKGFPSLVTNCNQLVLRRSFNDTSVDEKTETRLKLADNIPLNYCIIYRVSNESLVIVAHSITMGSLVGVPIFYLIPILQGTDIGVPVPITENAPVVSGPLEAGLLACCLGLAVFQVMSIVTRYAIRIYHDEASQSYKMVFRHPWFPWATSVETFKAGEVRQSTKGIMPWSSTSLYEFNNRKAIIFDHYFRKPIDFNNMLGIPQRPVDLQDDE